MAADTELGCCTPRAVHGAYLRLLWRSVIFHLGQNHSPSLTSAANQPSAALQGYTILNLFWWSGNKLYRGDSIIKVSDRTDLDHEFPDPVAAVLAFIDAQLLRHKSMYHLAWPGQTNCYGWNVDSATSHEYSKRNAIYAWQPQPVLLVHTIPPSAFWILPSVAASSRLNPQSLILAV